MFSFYEKNCPYNEESDESKVEDEKSDDEIPNVSIMDAFFLSFLVEDEDVSLKEPLEHLEHLEPLEIVLDSEPIQKVQDLSNKIAQEVVQTVLDETTENHVEKSVEQVTTKNYGFCILQ